MLRRFQLVHKETVAGSGRFRHCARSLPEHLCWAGAVNVSSYWRCGGRIPHLCGGLYGLYVDHCSRRCARMGGSFHTCEQWPCTAGSHTRTKAQLRIAENSSQKGADSVTLGGANSPTNMPHKPRPRQIKPRLSTIYQMSAFGEQYCFTYKPQYKARPAPVNMNPKDFLIGMTKRLIE